MEVLIGVDVGGTNIVCGILNLEGNILETIKEPTEAMNGSAFVIDKIRRMIEGLVSKCDISLENVRCVGIGTPGLVDPIKGVSLFAANLNWRDVPLADELTKLLNVPTYIDNDVRMYILGEVLKGSGQGYEHVLGLTVGTGLASASMQEGRQFYGGGYMAGELGHIPIEGIHQRCSCGMVGCLEIYVSAPGMVRQVRSKIDEGHETILTEGLSDLTALKSVDISNAYDAGDIVAKQVFKKTGELLAKGLACAIPILSPDVVIIGGGVALAGERLLAPMRDELRKILLPMYFERIKFTAATHNDYAGVFGSALNAMQRLGMMQD